MSYQERLNRYKRSPQKQELGVSCLCCNDAGFISRWTARKYLLDYLQGDMRDEYEESMNVAGTAYPLNVNQPPLVCSRKGCKGGVEPLSKQPRFPDGFGQTIPPEVCQWVHEQELDALRSNIKPAVNPLPAIATLTKAKAMVADPEPVNEVIEEHEGFKLGDRVRVTLRRLEKRAQREMRRTGEVPDEGQWGCITHFERVAYSRGERVIVYARLDSGETVRHLPGYYESMGDAL
ncbi:MAG: hypothetical protein AAFX78_10175 [Cyanobacteria bacterium J06638_20]